MKINEIFASLKLHARICNAASERAVCGVKVSALLADWMHKVTWTGDSGDSGDTVGTVCARGVGVQWGSGAQWQSVSIAVRTGIDGATFVFWIRQHSSAHYSYATCNALISVLCSALLCCHKSTWRVGHLASRAVGEGRGVGDDVGRSPELISYFVAHKSNEFRINKQQSCASQHWAAESGKYNKNEKKIKYLHMREYEHK